MKKISIILTIASLVFLFCFAFQTKIYACCGGWYWCCDGPQPLYECSNNCHSCSSCQGPPPEECNPGTCGGCAPVCPAGQSTTVSGSLCASGSVSSCAGSNGCTGCTLTGAACYYPETNTTFVQSNGSTAGPVSLTITVDGTAYALSTDPANPTLIQLPCTTAVSVAVPAFTAPATSRGGGYYFQADNYGTADQWKGWTTCSGKAPGEDFCRDSGTATSTTFTPTSLATSLVLKEGATGQISSQYYTINKCDNNKKYSTARVGYYRVETNTPVSAPTNTNMIIDNVTYALSSNPASPTIVKIPNIPNGTASLSEPTFSLPSYSKTLGYAFSADNYGVSNQWLGGTACTGIAGEDFCIENTTNTQTFTPATKTMADVLRATMQGKIASKYYTTNRCGNNKQYSTAYNSYYLVDSEPSCVDCTPSVIIPDLNTDITAKQCMSTTYTGKDIHNPLHFKVDVTDTNGLSDITGLIVWFSKDNFTPSTVTISGTNPKANVTSDIGVFIRKNGATWNTPLMYGFDGTSGTWAQTANGDIQNIAGEVAIKIQNIVVTTSATATNFDFRLEFLTVATNPSGLYNFYLNGVDTYMINNNIVDQSRLTKYFSWGIDLTDPVAGDISQQVQDAINTRISWSASDTISGIARTVINGYRVSGRELDIAKLYLPSAYTVNKGNVVLNSIPSSSNIGLYNDSNSWIFIGNTGETDLLNIGTNEGGKIDLYVTTYDAACNTNGTSEEVDLNPWFATRGGAIYSQDNISSNAKDVSSVTALNGVFSTNTLMDKSLIDLGTELLATRNTTISTLIHSNFGAVRGALLYDSNNIKNYWFDELMIRFNRTAAKSSIFSEITTSVSSDCPIGATCYNYSDEDINIPSGYTCDKPTLFASKKNINIEPNITSNSSSLSGCIFLAGNNINILDGVYHSTGSKIEYDYLEGYMIAENQINFPLVDISQSLRDGIEIFGGAVALGSSPAAGEGAISIKRDLRLFSQTNPAVVLTYDNKFSSIATIFFGAEAPIFRQEIGFKSF